MLDLKETGSEVLLPPPTRTQIEAFEAHLLKHEQANIPVRHRFTKDQYFREIVIPAGTIMTGAVHKHEHVSIMISGEMVCLTESGMQHISGYNAFISPAGTKRVGVALQETVWITVHSVGEGWDESRIKELESYLVEPSVHNKIGGDVCQSLPQQ